MFLSDDTNTAIFAEEDSGRYSAHLLLDKAHYEVNGDTSSAVQPDQIPSAPASQLGSTSRGAPVGASGPPSSANTPPSYRRAQSKTFARLKAG